MISFNMNEPTHVSNKKTVLPFDSKMIRPKNYSLSSLSLCSVLVITTLIFLSLVTPTVTQTITNCHYSCPTSCTTIDYYRC